MPRVMGIDPGTSSWDLAVLEDGRLCFERAIPTTKVKSNPEKIVKLIESLKLDLLVAPSGYGLPLKKVRELTPRDLKLIALKKKAENVMGLSKVLKLLKDTGVEAYIIPGVKHLPTVPEFRKINKIDMGTPDKVCSAALAIAEQANRLRIDYEKTSFILIELGSAFNAVLAVENGKIVDGTGGTLASLGFLSVGRMDGELAYLLGGFEKELLYRGGVRDIIGKDIAPREFLRHKNTPAFKAYIEGILKDIAAMRISMKKEPWGYLISGKMASLKQVLGDKLGNVKAVKGFAKVKHSAQGAALIADGLAGGKYKTLVECMQLKRCRHSIMDFLYLGDPESSL